MNTQLFIKFNKELFSRETKDGLLLLDSADKFLYVLRGTALNIWNMADGKSRIQNIIEDVSCEFNAAIDIVKKDVIDFLKKANKENPPIFLLSKTPIRS